MLSEEQQRRLSDIQAQVEEQLAEKPKRLKHVLGVCETAAELATTYEVDEFYARAAALLHDWCKAKPDIELVDEAKDMGIDLGVDLELVAPLLHGFIAARILPAKFPDLSADVFSAIERHTTGSADMALLDMVLFVADGIEPSRPDADSIREIREQVGKCSLEELFWMSFSSGISYVIATERYLWPGTIEIYNELVLKQNAAKERA